MTAGPIRLVATDLDGTLLRDDGSVSEYTKGILQRVGALVPIVLVTARPPRTVGLMARAIGLQGAVICCNGALVYDVGEDKRSVTREHIARPWIRIRRSWWRSY